LRQPGEEEIKMSLIFCPECGHEISTGAVACPSCGRPISPPVAEKKYVVTPPVREAGFPKWVFIPIGLLGVILLFVIYLALRGPSDSAETNVNVKAAARHETPLEPIRETKTTSVPSTESQTVTLPPGQTTTTTTVPSTITSSAPIAPPPLPDKGTVRIIARVVPRTGPPHAVRNAKFYLLDKDVETILGDAHLEPIEGNDLAGSLGLAIVFPDRYGDFLRNAMRAVGAHSKYSGMTDGTGNANMQGIMPKEYYLFGITKVGHGFALWNSPVSVIAGENNLELSPQSVTEIPDTVG
jgi:zinc-ribbon domain